MFIGTLRLIAIISALFLGISAYADHLLGGEVSYTHISDQKYRVHVTLYRDCNGSKLGGTGGGSSTSNHSDLAAAYLRTSSNSTCSSPNENIGTINLSKLSYENITASCATARTACEDDPNFNYGIEAHYYTGTVDFENYGSYQGCGLEIFISISDRSNDLTTLQSGSNFYNYAYIYPWNGSVNSPSFNTTPKVIYEVNRTSRESVAGSRDQQTDSLAYKWDYPLRSHTTALNYKSGFDKDHFITPYCPGGDCSPNPNATVAEGIYLNSSTGNIVFTPTSQGDIGTMVVTAEQWRKVNNTSVLVSKVRRDIVVAVVLSAQNNIPTIQANAEYNFCEGDDIRIQLSSTDADNDSVYLDVLDAAIFNDSSYFSNSARQNLLLKVNADSSMVGSHVITVLARDDNCPLRGVNQFSFTVNINPKPRVSLFINELFCGMNELNVSSDLAGNNAFRVFDDQMNVLHSNSNANSLRYQSDEAQDIIYRAIFTSTDNCRTTVETTVNNSGNSKVEPVSLNGATIYCEGEYTDLSLQHNEHTISAVNWWRNGTVVSNTNSLNDLAEDGTLIYSYVLIKDGIECTLLDSTTLTINPLPQLSFDDPADICHSAGVLDLNTLNASPIYGEWMLNENELQTASIDLYSLPNSTEQYELTYKVIDGQTFCENTITKELKVLESPEMLLRDVTVCGTSHNFRLTNAITAPSHFTPENISWDVLGHSSSIIGSHPLIDLDVQSLGVGNYTIVAVNTGTNGCLTKDTAILTVDQGLVLTSNGRTTICQADVEVDLNSYLEINATGGGWYSDEASDLLIGGKFTPSRCGVYTLYYTYDAFGCYDQFSVDMEVVCKPVFNYELPKRICQNSAVVNLPTEGNGTWAGNAVSNNSFDPYTPIGVYFPSYTATIGQCIFDTIASIEVIESYNVTLLDAPDKLCEGEELQIQISKDANSNLQIDNCNNSLVTVSGNTISYMPESCDLSNGTINLRLTASGMDICPADELNLSVPYHALPRVLDPQPISECWPYRLDERLDLKAGIDPSIQYTLTGAGTIYTDQGNTMSYAFPAAGDFSLRVQLTDVTGCENNQFYPAHYSLSYSPAASFDIDRGQVVSLADRVVNFKNTSTIYEGTFSNQWVYSDNGQETTFSRLRDPRYELPADTGTFDLKLITASGKGCKDSASIEIRVVPDLVIYIPNAFSPNEVGPSDNNRFRVICDNVSTYRLKIYNRYGQKVFDSRSIEESWDGTYMGQKCDIGVYLYYLEMSNKAGVDYQFQGTVNLLR